MKVTVDSIRTQIDLLAVYEILRSLREMGDYERRLVAMGLATMNKNARGLPPKSAELLGGWYGV